MTELKNSASKWAKESVEGCDNGEVNDKIDDDPPACDIEKKE